MNRITPARTSRTPAHGTTLLQALATGTQRLRTALGGWVGGPGDPYTQWRVTASQSPVGLCLVDLDGGLRLPNRAFAAMIGYDEAELVSHTFQEVTHPDDLDTDVDLYLATLAGERSGYRLVKRFLHADGHVVWADLSVALVRSADGTPRHFISQVLDVTPDHLDRERLAHATELIEHERILSQAVLDAVDVGMVLVDSSGDPVRINRRQREILAAAEVDGAAAGPGRTLHFYDADGRTLLRRDQLPSVRAARGEELDDERIWVGPDPASRRALSVSARTVRDTAGDPAGAALAYSDVTDLVQALRARAVFASSVSHELRTPLTSVLGNLELLLDSGDMPEQATHQLEVAHRNATRLRSLVSDLLDPASGDRGVLAMVRAPADVAALAREAVESLQPAAGAAGLSVVADAEGPARALVDAHRVRQVLDNLLSNAIKYTDVGGRVDLAVLVVGPDVVLTVTDTGIGIAPADVDRLFDPFFRTDPARERPSPGAGLGLGIAQSIAVAHGGRIDVSSRPGHGSMFRVALPRGNVALAAPAGACAAL